MLAGIDVTKRIDQVIAVTLTHTLSLRSRSPVARVMLSVLVCALLLQTPLPVVHQHSEYGLGGQLVIHLDRYHGGLSEQPDEFHWHFMLPRLRSDQGDQPEQSPPLDAGLCYLTASGAIISSAALESIDLEQPYREWISAVSAKASLATLCRVDAHQRQPSLRPRVRLCALHCVIRC